MARTCRASVPWGVTMYTNSFCTLYLKSRNYQPVSIPHCFYTDTSISSASKTGLDYSESAFCIFKTDDHLVFTNGHDFLIAGSVIINVDFSSDQGLSDSLKQLQNAGAKTIMRADYKDYGTARMRHWELSCK